MRVRRKHDSQLDEICSDYEKIATEISQINKQDRAFRGSELNDLQETLSALHKEINQILGQPQSCDG